MKGGRMSEEEQSRLLAKAIIDYNDAAKQLESWRARARELAEGMRAVSTRIGVELEGKHVLGSSAKEAYPTKDEVGQALRNVKDAEGRVKRAGEGSASNGRRAGPVDSGRFELKRVPARSLTHRGGDRQAPLRCG